MNRRLVRLGSVLVMMIIPLTAQAALFVAQEKGEIVVAEPVADDAYLFGNRISISGDIDGDVMAFGQTIAAESKIAADIYSAGQMIGVGGNIGDDVHVAGNEIAITGNVAGDAFAVGQGITIAQPATIRGDVYAAGQTIDIWGTVAGTVRATGENITVRQGGHIGGDLIVWGKQPAIEEGATVAGDIIQRTRPEGDRRPTRLDMLARWVRDVLMLTVIGFILVFALPHITRGAILTVKQSPGKSVLTSILWLILLLPASAVLIATVVGIPLALIFLLLTPILYIIGAGLSAGLIGSLVMDKLTRVKSPAMLPSWQNILLGAVMYEAAQLLGFVGWLLTLLVVLFTFGAFIQAVWSYTRSNSAKPA